MVESNDWKAQDDPNTTWNKITSCIKRVAKDVLEWVTGWCSTM